MRKKIISLALTVLIFIIASLFLFFITDFPLQAGKKSGLKIKTAAIAIRDNVIPFQKFGTQLFTCPYLEKHYDTLFYFTQYSQGDKQEKFIRSLEYALANYDQTDMYLLAHSNNYYSWLSEIDTALIHKIRMVYNTGCSNAYQADEWLNAGVSAYVAHTGKSSMSPVFYFYFLRYWTQDGSLLQVVEKSNDATKKFIRMAGYISMSDSLSVSIIENTTAAWFGNGSTTIENNAGK